MYAKQHALLGHHFIKAIGISAESLCSRHRRYPWFDEWEAEYREITEEITVTNDAGEEVTEAVETGERELIREAGNRYGVRYEELLAFIISIL